ncbi:uncharacterized protein LOC131312846 [Rhododendron vialii]|uniref:uncharacterized protein LOC131312846 n=1 Tax=Rhododendron vialii TaxID=182163 RepID=UPI00265F2F85|nr:uncharacterized protein LOC131312846 [Rhododendron vialii]
MENSFNMMIVNRALSISCCLMMMMMMMFNLAVAVPQPAIKAICDATDYPALCQSSIIPYLDGHTDPASVLIMHILAGIHTTEEAIQIAKHALPSATHYDAQRYEVCLDTYDSAMDSWKSAIRFTKVGKGFEVANDLSAVASMISSCDDAFTDDDPTVPNKSPLGQIDQLLMHMDSNCLAIRLKAFPDSN